MQLVLLYLYIKKKLFYLLSYRVKWSPLNVKREFLSTLVFKFFCWGGGGGGEGKDVLKILTDV